MSQEECDKILKDVEALKEVVGLDIEPIYQRQIKIVRHVKETESWIPIGVADSEYHLLDDLSSDRPPAMYKNIITEYFRDKSETDFIRIEELLLFYYGTAPDDRAQIIRVVDPVEDMPAHFFVENDYKERINVALSVLYELKDNRFSSKRKKKEIKNLTDYLTNDGKRLYPYILTKLNQVTKIIPFAEVHVVLVKKGYLKTDLLPKRKGNPQRDALVKLYHEAFGFDGDPSTFIKHVKKLNDMDPLSDNCQALALEFKQELRRIITSHSQN